MPRERKLITEGSPCDVNYFDKDMLSIEQARIQGRQKCENYGACQKTPRDCALRYGREVAKYVVKGGTLKGELSEFSEAPFLDNLFWTSDDGRLYERLKGKAKFLGAVERFARVVLLMDVNEHVFPHCESCEGVKLTQRVYDSIHDGLNSLSGSGKTNSRDVEYCPECDSEPRGTIVQVDPLDEIVDDMRVFRKD
ncbi:hypothetical protein CMI46_02255 [Candidatus Pacearchaeota archaeon]|nr:hypothetical protein [Candidatus Pacearchaeota archaeon]|tara:strand:- start:17417 stop:18001 length:585 start_codon:yes stop_codon:yes gene_type:complete